MTNPPESSLDILGTISRIEASMAPMDEHAISSELRRAVGGAFDSPLVPDSPEFCEIIAFEFHPEYSDITTGWGTYFGPMMVFPDGAGRMRESPSITVISAAVIEYWHERGHITPHPTLRARYADLVWDLSRRAGGAKPEVACAHLAIDGYRESAQLVRGSDPLSSIRYLRRAMSLARMIKDNGRIQTVTTALLDLEEQIAEDGMLGLWGFSFDILLESPMLGFPPEDESRIIEALEARLARICSPASTAGGLDPHGAQSAAQRLASYYRRKGEDLEARRVIAAMGDAFRRAAQDASPLVGAAWLKEVFDVYLQYGMKAEADELSQEIARLAKEGVSELKSIAATHEIEQADIETFLSDLLVDDLGRSLNRIAIHFVVRRGEVESQLKRLSKIAPISFLMSRTLVDHEGRHLATIGPLAEDLEGNVVRQIAENASLSGFFLQAAMDKLRATQQLTPESFVAHLLQSPAYTEGDEGILLAGVAAFMREDHLAAVHILIPRVESAIRRVGQIAGAPQYRPGRNGGLLHRTLDDLLREPAIEAVFGEDTVLYLRVLLTDPRGWNLRNTVAHGIASPAAFTSHASLRVLHAVLIPALVRNVVEPDSDQAPSPEP